MSFLNSSCPIANSDFKSSALTQPSCGRAICTETSSPVSLQCLQVTNMVLQNESVGLWDPLKPALSFVYFAWAKVVCSSCKISPQVPRKHNEHRSARKKKKKKTQGWTCPIPCQFWRFPLSQACCTVIECDMQGLVVSWVPLPACDVIPDPFPQSNRLSQGMNCNDPSLFKAQIFHNRHCNTAQRE